MFYIWIKADTPTGPQRGWLDRDGEFMSADDDEVDARLKIKASDASKLIAAYDQPGFELIEVRFMKVIENGNQNSA